MEFRNGKNCATVRDEEYFKRSQLRYRVLPVVEFDAPFVNMPHKYEIFSFNALHDGEHG